MKSASAILTFFAMIVSCNQKEMTLQDLQTAKWDSLKKGVYYISTEDQKQASRDTDSVQLKLKGITGEENTPLEISTENIDVVKKEVIYLALKQDLLNSRSGYLKINLQEMLRPERLTGIIYLRDDNSGPNDYSLDSAALIDINEIRFFSFMSKEEAKKKYLADGNSDWDKVLNENPLPNSFEIVLVKRDWSEESINELKDKIHDKLVMESEVSFPMIWVKKSDDYFFFEYKRK